LKNFFINILNKELETYYIKFIHYYGVVLPEIIFHESNVLDNNSFEVYIREELISAYDLFPDKVLIYREDKEDLEFQSYIENRDEVLQSSQIPSRSQYDIEKINEKKSIDCVFEELTLLFRLNIDKIITIQYVHQLIKYLSTRNSFLISLFQKYQISEFTIQEILISLVIENISIRDSEFILEKIIKYSARGIPDKEILKHLRVEKKNQIIARYLRNNNQLFAMFLPPAFEEILKTEIETEQNNIHTDKIEFFITHILSRLENYYKTKGYYPILVVSEDLRIELYQHLSHKNKMITVLSYKELSADIDIEVIEFIDLPVNNVFSDNTTPIYSDFSKRENIITNMNLETLLFLKKFFENQTDIPDKVRIYLISKFVSFFKSKSPQLLQECIPVKYQAILFNKTVKEVVKKLKSHNYDTIDTLEDLESIIINELNPVYNDSYDMIKQVLRIKLIYENS
jgi:hypothetical protein